MVIEILNGIIEGWEKEVRFCGRKWRFDYAHKGLKVAVEIEGGVWVRGRHNRAMGYIRDMEKYNEAVMRGWKVLRYTWKQLDKMVEDIKRIKNEARTRNK